MNLQHYSTRLNSVHYLSKKAGAMTLSKMSCPQLFSSAMKLYSNKIPSLLLFLFAYHPVGFFHDPLHSV